MANKSIKEESYYKSFQKYLKEDAAEDLSKWMDTPLKSLGAEPVSKLSADAQALVAKGKQDGSQSDDTNISTAGGSGFIALKKLLASQNEVGMNQSLSNVLEAVNATWDGINWGDINWMIEHMKPGAQISFSNAILAAKTKDGIVVLDGHHRWSQAFMLNPDGQVNVAIADASQKTADETLKAVHLAILAKTGQSKTKGAKGGNLFTASEGDIKGFLDKAPKVDPKTGEASPTGVAPYVAAVMRYNNITDPIEGEKQAISRVMAAIVACAGTVLGTAPSRDAMPQADMETNPVDADTVLSALDSGEINYNPPFKQESIVQKRLDNYLKESITNIGNYNGK